MEINIIQANEENWEDYKNIRLSTLKEEPKAFSSRYCDAIFFTKQQWIELLSDKNSIYLLAYDGKKVVGVIRTTFTDPEENPNTALIGGFYIVNAYRTKGIGSKLIKQLLEKILENECIKSVRLYVKKTQNSAISIYKKNEFVQIGIKDDELIMEKIL